MGEILKILSEVAVTVSEFAGITIKLLNEYNGAVTAAATVFIGVFTCVLARVTRRQAELTREGIDLARDEFRSTHRPEIAIHSLTPIHDGTSNERIAVVVTYVNKGRGRARILMEKGRITQRSLPLPSGWPEQVQSTPLLFLASGQRRTYIIASDISLTAYKAMPRLAGQRNIWVLCNGSIFYEDDAGVRRETGFLRRLQAEGDIEQWEKVEDSEEYEYAY